LDSDRHVQQGSIAMFELSKYLLEANSHTAECEEKWGGGLGQD
jgi:hypothetical protein